MHKIRVVNQGDVLTFKVAGGRHKALLCTSTYKERSPQNFTFAALTYDSVDEPTVESICESEFYGIGNRKSDYFKYSDSELRRIWTIHPEIKPYDLGSYGLIIWRKDFMKFRDNFKLVGNIDIIDHLDKNGSGGINASDWSFLQSFFNEKFETFFPDKGQRVFKVKAILRN
jgi:hypothetical protein